MLDLSNVDVGFEYSAGDETTRREIARNVKTILATPVGTCPLYRNFGINADVLDKPLNVAKNILAVQVIEAVERWEPRVKVRDVNFSADGAGGRLSVKVVVEVAG